MKPPKHLALAYYVVQFLTAQEVQPQFEAVMLLPFTFLSAAFV